MTCRVVTIAATAIALAGAALPSAAQQTPPPQPTFRWDDHPSIRLGRGTHIDFRARFQLDGRRSDAPLTDQDDAEFDVARRRLGVEGEIKNIVEFQVEREFAHGDEWRDVYAN